MFWLKICVIACDLHLEIVYSAGFCETVYYRVTHNNWRHFLLDVSISFLLSLNNFLKIISYLVLYLVHLIPVFPEGGKSLSLQGILGVFPIPKAYVIYQDMPDGHGIGKSWNLWSYHALTIPLISCILSHLVYRIS